MFKHGVFRIITSLAMTCALAVCLTSIPPPAYGSETQKAAEPLNQQRQFRGPGLHLGNGKRRLDFEIPDMDGVIRDAGEWDGRVVAMIFWAPWDPYTHKTMPELIKLQDRYLDQGLQIVSLTIYHDEAKVSDFFKDFSINFPVLIGKKVDELAQGYGLVSIPRVIFIDRKGNVRFEQIGYDQKNLMERVIKELL